MLLFLVGPVMGFWGPIMVNVSSALRIARAAPMGVLVLVNVRYGGCRWCWDSLTLRCEIDVKSYLTWSLEYLFVSLALLKSLPSMFMAMEACTMSAPPHHPASHTRLRLPPRQSQADTRP